MRRESWVVVEYESFEGGESEVLEVGESPEECVKVKGRCAQMLPLERERLHSRPAFAIADGTKYKLSK
jgi:hypothetical protein